MARIISTQDSTYPIRHRGALNSPIVDWCGDVIISAEKHNATLQVSSTFNLDTIRGFLDQFQDLSLSILPAKSTENEIVQKNT
jgi:hypothetical protein